ncbi:protein FAM24A-like isoform X2 [Castor canadensis]|uniref:Protein FAM24A-like n=2 Tax=Castor canadensis TaxID=51338 RepID=A0A8C0WY79_CASCN|nr:protein FAM24A-like [Castor canadensis]
MFDLKTKIMIGIVSGLLIAAIVLIGIVFCLYFKVSKALKLVKEPDAVVTNCSSGDKLIQDKVIPAKTNTTESCPAIQCCDECSLYADVDPLPPCFCSPNEGL